MDLTWASLAVAILVAPEQVIATAEAPAIATVVHRMDHY